MSKLKSENAFLLGIHMHSFRRGDPALIIGLHYIKPENSDESRLCYHVVFNDGVKDFSPVNDNAHKVISFEEILSGKYKEYLEFEESTNE